MSSRLSRTIYVGNLPGDIRKREIEDLFYKYGPIVDIELKIPARPPGYAFVEFEDRRDAEDAIYGRDGYEFDGYRLRVELAHGGQRSPVDRYRSYSGSSSSRSRRSDYRVLVTGLPSSASWQDLKDHMRRAGDVCFSEVNAFSRAYIRVKEYDSHRNDSRSPSRSPDYSRSRSPSYSNRSRSKSPRHKPSRRSPSVSPARSLSPRSPSRSRSRSRSPLSPSSRKEGPRGHSLSRSPRSVSRSRSPSVRSD